MRSGLQSWTRLPTTSSSNGFSIRIEFPPRHRYGFLHERRQEVINHVTEKYGRDHVAQIITFGTLGAEAAIHDVGRVLEIPYDEVDTIAKLIPSQLNMTIAQALAEEPIRRLVLPRALRSATCYRSPDP